MVNEVSKPEGALMLYGLAALLQLVGWVVIARSGVGASDLSLSYHLR
jgi:hypothetical protein